jgi:hypothetical protein
MYLLTHAIHKYVILNGRAQYQNCDCLTGRHIIIKSTCRSKGTNSIDTYRIASRDRVYQVEQTAIRVSSCKEADVLFGTASSPQIRQ